MTHVQMFIHSYYKLIVNKHLYLCHLLVVSTPTLMMHGLTNLKLFLTWFKQLSKLPTSAVFV